MGVQRLRMTGALSVAATAVGWWMWGALAAVLVAQVCAFAAQRAGLPSDHWPAREHLSFGARVLTADMNYEYLDRMWKEAPGELQAVRNSNLVVVHAGWPWHVVWGALDLSPRAPWTMQRTYGAFAVMRDPLAASPVMATRVIPLQPIWSALCLSGAAYGLVIASAVGIQRDIRRQLRVNAHRCATCGYALEFIAGGTCPECGALIGNAPTPWLRAQRVAVATLRAVATFVRESLWFRGAPTGFACAVCAGGAAMYVDARWWFTAWPIAIAGAGFVTAVVGTLVEFRRRPAIAWQPVLAAAVCAGVVLTVRSQLNWIAQYAN